MKFRNEKWRMAKLGDIFKISSGGTPSKSKPEYYENGTVPWVRTGDLKDKYIAKVEGSITEKALNNSSAKLFPANTVLIAMYGATIGACSILSVEAATNQACAAFLPTKEVDSSYLYYFLRSKKDDFVKMGVGGAQPNISATILKSVTIPLPPLETQKQIANTLDTAAELLGIRKQQLTELDNLIKSTFYDMFGDPVTNEKGWDISTVEKVCKKIMGGGTPSKSHSEYYIGTIPWVTPKDMKTIWINDSIDHINEDAIKNSSANLIPSNSVLMVIRSGILKRSLPIAINTVDIAINQDMKAFITNNKVVAEYLLYFFVLMQNNILKNVRAVTADNIEFSLIKNLIIPLPPLKIQTQFAQIVTKIEEQKTLIKQASNETQYLFDSLMAEYFE